MSTFDIIILVLLAIGAIGGFRKGFVLEIVGIIALILGIFGAIKLLQVGMDIMKEQFDISSQFLPYITFIILFVLIIIGINIVGRLIKAVIHLTPLGVIDYIGGAIIGILKWAVAISFLLWITALFGFNFFQPGEESIIYDYIAGIAPWILEQVKFITPLIKDTQETQQALLV